MYGHSIGACHPISASIPISDNVVVSGVLKILDIIAFIMPTLSIKAMVVPIVIGDAVNSSGLAAGCMESSVALLKPSNKLLVDFSVSLISNEVLKTQLVGVDQNDWLEESLSSPCGGDGEDFHGHEDDVQAMFILKDNRVDEKAFALGGGKRGRRNSKRK
ncbi:hypothetical protein IEQ34_014332 [Dendrobium chrysotoxum]|uniref:Uncharacterized protein n=1 Tax=Dendrobium chrysotoxum TaxID=161865 RepID=A0AAV7GKY1_DENCH|nr:hypothetical protein IEQ34_014332 [Dendrobium chrysotoxum]